jgi:hypothetical protein
MFDNRSLHLRGVAAKPTQIEGILAAMFEVLLSASVSILVGVTLWALLPRGVVLTRSFPAVAPDGRVLPDTWRIRNESPLPVRIRSVAVSGVGTYDDTKGALRWVEVGTEDEDGLSATLHLDDEVTEIRRLDNRQPWRAVVVAPGDTMQAHVLNNTTLRIRYRRAGAFGTFERREIQIHGGA